MNDDNNNSRPSDPPPRPVPIPAGGSALPTVEDAPGPVNARLEQAAEKYSTEHDQKSFTVLFLAAQKPMSEMAQRMGVRFQDIDDVVQDAALALWTHRDSFAGGARDFIALSCGFTRTCVMTARKRNRRWRSTTVVPRGSTPLAVGLEDTHEDISPEDAVMTREAMHSLTAYERQILSRWAEGRSMVEIGRELGVSGQRAGQIHASILERLRKAQ